MFYINESVFRNWRMFMKQSLIGPIYLSIAASIWGGMYVSSKYLLETIPPMSLLFIRYLIAAVVLLGVCMYYKSRLKKIQHWHWFLQVGFIGYFLSIGTQFLGTKLSNAHLASLITTLSPIFLSAFAVVLLKENMTKKQFVSMFIAVFGLVTIVGLPSSDGENILYGNLILIFTSISWGYYSVIARKASQHYPPIQLTTIGILLATLFTFPVALTEWNEWQVAQLFDWSIIFNILFIGVIATALAFFSWNKGLELTPSHQAGLFFFLQPIVGTLLGWSLLGEQLSVSFIIGSMFIICGVYFNMRQNDASRSYVSPIRDQKES